MSDDYSANTLTDGTVAVGGTETGTIETGRDRDWFAVELVAGRTYTIDLKGRPTGDGTLRDPRLYGIYDNAGTLIGNTGNDDAGTGYNSRVTFTATATGTFYIEAGAYSRHTGSYTVAVTDTSPPGTPAGPNVDDTRTGSTDLGDITDLDGPRFPRGSVDGGGDRIDYYGFTLTEARKVVLGLRRQDADANLFIEDDQGNVLHAAETAGTTNEALNVTLLAGSYYVRIEAREEGDNAYVFRYGVDDPDAEELARLQQQGTQQPPAFPREDYAFDLAENADGSTDPVSLGTVETTDPDSPVLTYSIEDGNDAGRFEIDETTGELFYTGTGEDFESESTRFDLTVRASDGGLSTDTTVTVNVTDVTERDLSVSVSEPEGDDFPAAITTSGVVAVDSLVTGNVETTGDVDWFAVTLTANQTYQIDLKGLTPVQDVNTLSNPYFRGVYDINGNLVEGTTDNNGGVYSNSRVTFTPDESSVYYVAAGGYSGSGVVGTYTLSVTDITDGITDDFAADASTIGEVAVGASVTGEIEISGDRDWFEVNLDANRIYRIDIEGRSTDAGTLFEPYLYGVHDQHGNLIADTWNAHDGVGRNSRKIFSDAEDANYYVAVGAYGDWEGTYKLSVTDVTDTYTGEDFAADTGTTGEVAVGASVTGEFEASGDRDWFAVDLEAGRSYRIDLHGSTTGGGTAWYPHLHGIHDADGNLIEGTDGNLRSEIFYGRLNKVLYFTAKADATYYVETGNYGHSLGTYTLSVTDVTDQFEDDFAFDTDTTGTVAVDGSITGEVEYTGDRDWFAVTLEANRTYQFDLKGYRTGDGTLGDPYLHGLYDMNGTLISGSTNDDGGGDRNSRVIFEATENAIYYVSAGGYSSYEGTYTLLVEDVTDRGDDFAADTSTTGEVAVGASVTGEFEASGDRDWVAVDLEAGRSYRIDLHGSSTGGGTAWNPYLHGLHDADGNLIEGTGGRRAEVGSFRLNKVLHFTAEADATYYVETGNYTVYYLGAGTYGVYLGTYTLSVEEVTDSL